MALTQTPEEGLKVSNAPSDGKFLQYKDSTDKLTWATAADGTMSNVVEDTTPQLGGNLDVQDKVITTDTGTNTHITIKPKGTGQLAVGPGDAEGTISANGTYNLRLKANAAGASGASVNCVSGANGNVDITPLGTGQAQIVSGKLKVAGNGTEAHVTAHGTSHLKLNTNEGTNSGEIEIEDGADNDIKITPNGTGDVVIDGLKYPQADGSSGQYLKTDGSGQLSWGTVSTAEQDASTGDYTLTSGDLKFATDVKGIRFNGNSSTGYIVADTTSSNAIITNVGGNLNSWSWKFGGTEKFTFNSTGNIAFANGNGIDFSSSGNESGMTSELLDDYEEGTYTVELLYNNTNACGFSTTAAGGTTGYYTKVGRMVTVATYIKQWTMTSGDGSAASVSLPFTVRDPRGQSPCSLCLDTGAFNHSNCRGQAETGGTRIDFYQNDSTTETTWASGGGNKYLAFCVVYQTD